MQTNSSRVYPLEAQLALPNQKNRVQYVFPKPAIARCGWDTFRGGALADAKWIRPRGLKKAALSPPSSQQWPRGRSVSDSALPLIGAAEREGRATLTLAVSRGTKRVVPPSVLGEPRGRDCHLRTGRAMDNTGQHIHGESTYIENTDTTQGKHTNHHTNT